VLRTEHRKLQSAPQQKSDSPWSVNLGDMPSMIFSRGHCWIHKSIVVPAGHFTALRYFNLIDFRYPNITGRNAGQRKENIWFAPEIGRWVVRESSGTFRQDIAEEFNESSYRWELLSWT
jgi:hypothetical protein